MQLGDSTRPDRLKKQWKLDALTRDRLGNDAALAAIAALGTHWQGAALHGTHRMEVSAAAKAALQSLATFEYLAPLLEVRTCSYSLVSIMRCGPLYVDC